VKNCFSDHNDGNFHPFQNGIVYRKAQNSLFVATVNGTLVIQEVKNEKGDNFINKIRIGDRFYTPIKYLDNAKQFRAVYTSKGLT